MTAHPLQACCYVSRRTLHRKPVPRGSVVLSRRCGSHAVQVVEGVWQTQLGIADVPTMGQPPPREESMSPHFHAQTLTARVQRGDRVCTVLLALRVGFQPVSRQVVARQRQRIAEWRKMENEMASLRGMFYMQLKARCTLPATTHPPRTDSTLWFWCAAGAALKLQQALQAAAAHEHYGVLHFPHNLDFRGRAYPMSPHLSHMGNDLCRGLLTFADAKPLGQHGFRWLLIHLANLYGEVDKRSFDERVGWALRKLPEIVDSADAPLGGRRWWLQGEAPWSVLATCKDIAAAVAHGDVSSYASRLPVHQDGSCNGLQHYAAMGRDVAGAQAVCLVDAPAPDDVYSKVMEQARRLLPHCVYATMRAAMLWLGRASVCVRARATARRVQVKEEVRVAAAGGGAGSSAEEAARARIAALALPEVNRKLVKQTVMTTVYGVTQFGARDQCLSRCARART